MQKAVKEMEQQLSAFSARVREFGGVEALELQQRAVKAFNESRYDDAIAYLRKAISASSRTQTLRAELSKVLTAAAITQANAANARTMRGVLPNILKMLREAIELDSSNVQAKESLAVAQKMSVAGGF
jgi:tetratricopeptide (TPR) repeat protein